MLGCRALSFDRFLTGLSHGSAQIVELWYDFGYNKISLKTFYDSNVCIELCFECGSAW